MTSSNKPLSAIKAVAVSLSLKLPRAIFIWFLISWVAGYFGTLEWRFELASHFKRYKALTDLIRAEDPDLLFIQEVTRPWEKQLEKIRNEYPHGVIRGAEDAGGIASLSRWPLLRADDAGIGDYNGPCLEIRLNIGNRLVHIINTHTPPPMGKLNSQMRNKHFEVIADRLRDLPAPKILIGDLNATMWSPYFKRLVERTGLVNAREGFGVLPTWPTHLPVMKIPIDHCLVSRDIRVVGVRTGPHIGSDHLPLVIDLVVPAGNEVAGVKLTNQR
jgi:endonuclease/exonuclease/phosphatase (EEP) superfamily protein YafD